MLNLNHLAVFDAVARAENVSRAGERLMISQPAVSTQLHQLERALGTKLVERMPRGVRLTEAGAVLAGYSRRIFALAEDAEQAMGDLRGLERGRLRIGASTTVGNYLLPPVLGRFRAKYPKIELTMEVANTHVVQQALLDHNLDLAVTEGFLHWPGLVPTKVAEDEMVPVAPPGHPICRRRGPTLADFCGLSLLVREEGSGTREVVEQALKDRGIAVTPFMTLGNTEAIKRSVAAGVGVAFVSCLAIEQELSAGSIVRLRLRDFRLRRELHLVQVEGRTLSRAARAFVDLLCGNSL